MNTISVQYKLSKSQAELDFVNIDLDGDIPLYVDPYALTTRDDDWSVHCHNLVISFFQAVLNSVQSNNEKRGIQLLSHLNEPEETHLGVSLDGNKGRGIGVIQAKELFKALKNSKAANTSLMEDLSDIALFIPGIGRDKISDMTTNIIRRALISYTQSQCDLHGVPTHNVSSGFFWDAETEIWRQEYVYLPVHKGKKFILVPKYTVRYQVGVDHAVYRSKFVLEFLQEDHLRADDSLVTVLKNKKGEVSKKVYKKTVNEHYPKNKDYLAEFSLAHPEVIENYRKTLKEAASKIPNINPDNFSEADLAKFLSQKLQSISSGATAANDYHNVIIGIISFMLFPNLIYPKKETEINEGRKRIDITYTNGKENGFFYRIALDQNIKANTVHVECKNYSNEIVNPEFDQLLGRFDHNRGKLGMLFYRASENPALVVARCRDAAKSNLGFILPIDDKFVISVLEMISNGNRGSIDKKIEDLYQSIIS